LTRKGRLGVIETPFIAGRIAEMVQSLWLFLARLKIPSLLGIYPIDLKTYVQTET
jgi:hypothetical protein